ncbi:hypothetical protein FQN52_003970 [Onygenales sp. PD_12]|nr:hypothetical protein FQN52_003970 [Onygenales sp. PD_12]
MASQYNLVEYDSDGEGPTSRNPLVSASSFITELLFETGTPYGIMSTFTMKALGKMWDSWSIMEAELRNTKKVVVLIDQGHDDCKDAIPAEVGLIEKGKYTMKNVQATKSCSVVSLSKKGPGRDDVPFTHPRTRDQVV